MNDPSNEPDVSRVLSRWSAPYWATKNGIAAALKSDARWAVLNALYTFLPNVEPGKDTIERMTGLSRSTVWSATKGLKAVGLIDYDDGNRGGSTRTNHYTVADIRFTDTVQQIVARVKGSIIERFDSRTVRQSNGSIIEQEGFDYRTEKGSIVEPEVRNISSQEKSGGATAPGGFATDRFADEEYDPYSGQDWVTPTASQDESPTAPGCEAGQADCRPVPTVERSAPHDIGGLPAAPAWRPIRRKGAKLTDADRAAARRDVTTVMGFLGYGMDGVDNPPDRWSDLQPYDRCWFHHLMTLDYADLNQLLPEATELQLAAWAWWRMNVLLHTNGLDLILPGSGADLMPSGRNRGILGDLFKTRGLAWCIRHVLSVTDQYDDIKDSLRWMQTPPVIGPGLFRERQVIKASDAITQGAREAA